jgi:hypothetical protein
MRIVRVRCASSQEILQILENDDEKSFEMNVVGCVRRSNLFLGGQLRDGEG